MTFGQKLFPRMMFVLYDGNCGLCRRTVARLEAVDVFKRIEFVNALDRAEVVKRGLGWLSEAQTGRDMYAVIESRSWAGFYAYRVLSLRIPLFWLVVPILYLWPIPVIGNWVYRRVADTRSCESAHAPR